MTILLIASFIFGTLIGSFLNVLILRLPKNETLMGRSHCMHCKHELSAGDLIPIFSYLSLKGKCRYCGKSISTRYFRIEIITGLLFAFAYLLFVPTSYLEILFLFKAWIASSVLLVIFMIDYEHYLILDKVVVPSTLILLFVNLLIGPHLALTGVLAGLGLFIFFGLLYWISQGRWMGFGDVKLTFLLGQITPGFLILINVLLAFGIGAVISIGFLLFKAKNLKSELPFGTFLSLSTFITFYLGSVLLYWYINVIGLGYLLK